MKGYEKGKRGRKGNKGCKMKIKGRRGEWERERVEGD